MRKRVEQEDADPEGGFLKAPPSQDDVFAELAASCAGLSAPLVLILVGKMGTGKSTLGNFLLGQSTFESRRSAKAVTEHCRLSTNFGPGCLPPAAPLVVLDTPGFGDPERPTATLLADIKELAEGCAAALQQAPLAPGSGRPRFCVVVVLGCHSRISEEDLGTIRALYHCFGT